MRLKYKNFSLTALLMIVTARVAQLKCLGSPEYYQIDLTPDLCNSLLEDKELQPYFVQYFTEAEIEIGLLGFFNLSEFGLPEKVLISRSSGERCCRMGYITGSNSIYLFVDEVE